MLAVHTLLYIIWVWYHSILPVFHGYYTYECLTQCQLTDPEEYGWKGDMKSFNP